MNTEPSTPLTPVQRRRKPWDTMSSNAAKLKAARKEAVKRYQREYQRDRYANDPAYRERCSIKAQKRKERLAAGIPPAPKPPKKPKNKVTDAFMLSKFAAIALLGALVGLSAPG